MDSAFHQLCPRYSGTLTPTVPTAIRLWETFTFYHLYECTESAIALRRRWRRRRRLQNG